MAKKDKKNVKDIEIEEVMEEKNEEVITDIEDSNIDELDIANDDEFVEVPVEERILNIENKVNWVVILLVINLVLSVVLVFGVFASGSEVKESGNAEAGSSDHSSSSKGYSTENFDVILGTDIEAASKNETIVIMLGQQGCGYCAMYAPYLEKVQEEYGIKAKYIDVSKITKESEYNAIVNLKGTGEYETFAKDTFGYTPITLIVKNNKVIGGIEGATDEAGIRTALEKAGFSKK